MLKLTYIPAPAPKYMENRGLSPSERIQQAMEGEQYNGGNRELCERYAKHFATPQKKGYWVKVDEQSIFIKGVSIGVFIDEENFTICYTGLEESPQGYRYWLLDYQESNIISNTAIYNSIIEYLKRIQISKPDHIYTNFQDFSSFKNLTETTVLDVENQKPITALKMLSNDEKLKIPDVLIEEVRPKLAVEGRLYFINALYLATRYKLETVMKVD
ncbi:hypothetical protein HW132_28885 [Brasilonema sp. CT11]|nr:hypothetical protein [Brasilonema sp. CT11]